MIIGPISIEWAKTARRHRLELLALKEVIKRMELKLWGIKRPKPPKGAGVTV